MKHSESILSLPSNSIMSKIMKLKNNKKILPKNITQILEEEYKSIKTNQPKKRIPSEIDNKIPHPSVQSQGLIEVVKEESNKDTWKCKCKATNNSTQNTCYSCKTNKNSISQTTSGLRNSYNKQQERPSFDNRVSGFPAERSPIKSRNDPNSDWNCPDCGTLNTISPYKCYYCFSYKDSSSKNSPAGKISSTVSTCSVCRNYLDGMEKRNCVLCGKRSRGGYCSRCDIQVSRHICDRCTRIHWVCINCGTSNSKNKGTCKCGFRNRVVINKYFEDK